MNDDVNEGLGQVVRALRARAGLTQEELGRRAGYGTGAGVSISRLESGLVRPGAERFARLADVLGLTPEELEARAAEQAAANAAAGAGETGTAGPPAANGGAPSRGSERPKERARRIQLEVDERTRVLTDLSDAFNQQHDRARADFLLRFVDIGSRVDGAPRLDSTALDGDDEATGPDPATAAPFGADAGAVPPPPPEVRGARTGASGSSRAVLAGIVGAPSLILAAGGLLWMKRNRLQQQELAAKLDDADAELAATRPGVDALQDLLPRATTILDYIATHAGHALTRWEGQLGPGPCAWEGFGSANQQRYQDFVAIAAAQETVVTIDVQGLLTRRGSEQDELIRRTDDLLTRSAAAVTARV